MTAAEKIEEWFNLQRANGLVDFKVIINRKSLAERFGGRVEWIKDKTMGDLPREVIIWPEDTDFDLVMATIQREMVSLINTLNDPTKTRIIRHDKDDFGNVTDDSHPDYQTEAARYEHVRLMRKSFPNGEVTSAYDLEFVLKGVIPPIPDFSYHERFAKTIIHMINRLAELEDSEQTTEVSWRKAKLADYVNLIRTKLW